MHRQMLQLLPQAEGHSCRVIAVFLDIRGFTSFAGDNESTDAAAFLRTMYLRILNEYFNEGLLFFKPTGDGLMIVLEHPADGDEFKKRMGDVLRQAIRLVSEFPTIAADDIMVNCEVPTKLGVGVARGSVTVLRSGETTLDYTGRCLNLAARLMDLARPCGVVFSDKFAERVLDGELHQKFVPQLPYLSGIVPAPIQVFVTQEWTEVPESALRPASKRSWTFDPSVDHVRVGELRHRTGTWAVPMQTSPLDDSAVLVRVQFERAVNDEEKAWTAMELPARCEPQPYGPAAVCDIAVILRWIAELGLPDEDEVTLQAKYLA